MHNIRIYSKLKDSVLLDYTIIFLFISAILLLVVKLNGSTLFFIPDGIYQHYMSFEYLCDYIQQLLNGSAEKINYTLGLGADITTTIGQYDFNDPVSIFTACLFFLNKYHRFYFMIFMKLWFIGVSFIIFCKSKKVENKSAILCGTLAYTFSTVNLFSFGRHPNFVNWAYFFPLILAGIEEILNNRKPLLFIGSIALNVLVSYYTFYMNVILSIIYYLVISITDYVKGDKQQKKKYILSGFKIIGYGCVGILLSAFVLFPQLYSYLESNRTSLISESTNLFHYSKKYYLNILKATFSPYGYVGSYTSIGIIPICFFCLLKLVNNKNQKKLVTLIIVSFLMICIPCVGKVLNGMGYITNRWSYALVFYMALAIVYEFEEIATLSKKEIYIIAFIMICYILIIFDLKITTAVTVIELILSLIVFIAISARKKKSEKQVIICIMQCLVHTILMFSPFGGNYLSSNYTADDAEMFRNTGKNLALDYKDDIIRVESKERVANVDGYLGLRSTGMWWSGLNKNVYEFYNTLNLPGVINNSHISDFDGRSALLAWGGVNYYVNNENDELIPYKFEKKKENSEEYNIYENKNNNSIIHIYDSYILKSEYETYNGLQKEQALIEFAVIDHPIKNIPMGEYKSDQIELKYSFINTSVETNKLVFDGKNSVVIEVEDEIPEDCEIYLYIDGVQVEKTNEIESTVTNVYRKNFQNKIITHNTSRLSNENYNWYVNRSAILYNLGICNQESNIIEIKASKSNISYKEIKVIAQPVDKIDAFNQKEKAEKVKLENDLISFDVTLDKDQIVLVTIPYSKGWKANIDGKPTEIINADIAFMSVAVPQGKHTVTFSYNTPWSIEGRIVSGITVLVVIVYILLIKERVNVKKDG